MSGEYGGVNGERLMVGCPDCGRAVMVADKEVDCQLIDSQEPVAQETAVGGALLKWCMVCVREARACRPLTLPRKKACSCAILT